MDPNIILFGHIESLKHWIWSANFIGRRVQTQVLRLYWFVFKFAFSIMLFPFIFEGSRWPASTGVLNKQSCFYLMWQHLTRLKGTVSVISSDLLFFERHVRFSSVPFKPLSRQRCTLYSVHHFLLVYTRSVSWHLISRHNI